MSEIQNAASNLKVPYWNNLSQLKNKIVHYYFLRFLTLMSVQFWDF